jgi:hypothetical protein
MLYFLELLRFISFLAYLERISVETSNKKKSVVYMILLMGIRYVHTRAFLWQEAA